MDLSMIMDALKGLAEAYLGQFGFFVALVTWVGTFRLIVKPIMTAIETIVSATPTKKDDEIFEKVKVSPAMWWFLFILDWLASIKVKVPAKTPTRR